MILKATEGSDYRIMATPLNYVTALGIWLCGGCYIRRREMSTFSEIWDNFGGIARRIRTYHCVHNGFLQVCSGSRKKMQPRRDIDTIELLLIQKTQQG